jgi:hypothetical protein
MDRRGPGFPVTAKKSSTLSSRRINIDARGQNMNRAMRKRLAGAALAALALLPDSTGAFEVGVRIPEGGTQAEIVVRHSPAQEPLGALRLKMRFRERAGVKAVTVFRPEGGAWSQVQPVLKQDGATAEVYALAPTIGASKAETPETIASLRLDLAPAPGAPLQGAADVIDSVWVEEALQPWGGASAVAPRLTTSVGGRAAAGSPAGARERAAGLSRILSFTLAQPARVKVKVLDVNGRATVRVFDSRLQKGMHEVVWNGLGHDGRPLPAGTWFLRLETAAFTYNRKLEVSP